MGPFPNLNVLPKSQRPKSSLDITDPTSICEGLTDRASFPKAFRNEKVEIQSQLGDSLAVHPPVLPELGGGTIANYHLGRGKKRCHAPRERTGDPIPARAEGDQFSYAKSSEHAD